MVSDYIDSVTKGFKTSFIPAPFRSGEKYSPEDFLADLVAGVTVAIILIPHAMAVALIAGLPAVYGLYAAIPGFIASLWGSSKHLSTGPVAIVSFLTLTSLLPLAEPGSAEFIALAATLALLVGVIQLFMGLFRLGFVLQLIPHSAIIGFASAAAAIIVTTQIPNLLGFETERHELVVQNIFEIFAGLPYLVPLTATIGAIAIGILYLCKFLPKTFPGTLVVLLVGIIASYVFNLGEQGVALVKEIPSVLPTFQFPTFSVGLFLELFPKAAIIALVGFVEAYAISRAIAQKTGQKLDTGQELVGQGLANIVVGMFRGYPVSGSFMRTAVNVNAGARTAIAAVVAAAITVLALLFLAPFLSLLPKTILAAIVIISAIPLINPGRLMKTYAISRTDGIVAFITFIFAFLLKPDDAIFIGVVVALVLFVRQTVWGAKVVENGIDTDWNTLRDINEPGNIETFPNVLVIRIGMPMYYANAAHIIRLLTEQVRLRKQKSSERLEHVVINFSGVSYIDATAMEKLEEFIKDLHEENITLQGIFLRITVHDAIKRNPDMPEIPVLRNSNELRNIGTAK